MKKTKFLALTLLAIISVVILGACERNKTPAQLNTISINNSAPMPLKKVYAIYEKDNILFSMEKMYATNKTDGISYTTNEEPADDYYHMMTITTINIDSLLNIIIKNPLAAETVMIPAPAVIVNIYSTCSNPNGFDFTDYTFNDDDEKLHDFSGDLYCINNPIALMDFIDGSSDGIKDLISGTLSIKDIKGTPEVTLKGLFDNSSVEVYYKGQFDDGGALMNLIDIVTSY